MHTTVRIGDGTRKRRPIRRIVIVAILLAALIEPLIMYKALMNERAQRRAIVNSSLASPALISGDEAGR